MNECREEMSLYLVARSVKEQTVECVLDYMGTIEVVVSSILMKEHWEEIMSPVSLGGCSKEQTVSCVLDSMGTVEVVN